MTARVELHAQALADADAALADLPRHLLETPSRCSGWSIRELVEHMTGQNFGFAEAITSGDAVVARYRPRSVDRWADSVSALRSAVAQPANPIRLAEVAPQTPFTLDRVLAIHALDLAIHTWDLGGDYRPADDLVQFVLTVAQTVPVRDAVGGPFAPALSPVDQDPWHRSLCLLGREPTI